MNYTQYETTIVDDGVQIGEGSRSWQLNLPLAGSGEAVCAATGMLYRLTAGGIQCVGTA